MNGFLGAHDGSIFIHCSFWCGYQMLLLLQYNWILDQILRQCELPYRIARGLQIGPMRKRTLHFLSIISSWLCKLTHLFLSILTFFAILRHWFLRYHFWMNYFLCQWHYAAMFYVSKSFLSAPPNPLHAFLSSWTSRWTVFDSFIVILSANYFLLKVPLLKICEIKPFSYLSIYFIYKADLSSWIVFC